MVTKHICSVVNFCGKCSSRRCGNLFLLAAGNVRYIRVEDLGLSGYDSLRVKMYARYNGEYYAHEDAVYPFVHVPLDELLDKEEEASESEDEEMSLYHRTRMFSELLEPLTHLYVVLRNVKSLAPTGHGTLYSTVITMELEEIIRNMIIHVNSFEVGTIKLSDECLLSIDIGSRA